MKSAKITCILLVFLSFNSPARCQETSLSEGDFKSLAASKQVCLKFTYDSMQVGKFKKESDYVEKRVAEINKKYPGKGDEWAANWVSQRKQLFEPAFAKAFMESSAKDTAASAPYTLIFNTSYIEQGFSTAAILVHKNPEVRGELVLIKSDDPTHILGKAKVTKALGKAGPHFETGEHIDAAYAQAGGALGEFILNH